MRCVSERNKIQRRKKAQKREKTEKFLRLQKKRVCRKLHANIHSHTTQWLTFKRNFFVLKFAFSCVVRLVLNWEWKNWGKLFFTGLRPASVFFLRCLFLYCDLFKIMYVKHWKHETWCSNFDHCALCICMLLN